MKTLFVIGRLAAGIFFGYAGITNFLSEHGALGHTMSNALLAIGLIGVLTGVYALLDEISTSNKRTGYRSSIQ